MSTFTDDVFDLGAFDDSISGALAVSETPDAAAITGAARVSGALASIEIADNASFGRYWHLNYWHAGYWAPHFWALPRTDWQVTVRVSGSAATTEAPDTAAGAGTVAVHAALAGTGTADTAAIGATGRVSGSSAITESADVAAFSGTVGAAAGDVSGVLAAIGAPDQANMAGTVVITGSLACIEAPDVAQLMSAPPAQSSGGGGKPRYYGLPTHLGRRPQLDAIQGELHATEAPDSCRIALETDWADDDAEFMFMSEAA